MTDKVNFDEYMKELQDRGVCPYCNENVIVMGCHAVCENCGFQYGCGD